MPRFKSLFKRHEVETAKRKRKCKHDNSHMIPNGQKCLVIYEDGRQRSVYCAECAKEMLQGAEDAIRHILQQLS